MLKRTWILMFIGWIGLAALSPARAEEDKPGPNKALPSLRDGLRLTYSYKLATIPGAVNGFKDPQDVLRVPTGETRTQVSITRIDGDAIVFVQAEFAIRAEGRLAPGSAMGFMEKAGEATPGSYWLTPQTMEKYLKVPAAGITALHAPFKIGGVEYDAVTITAAGPNFQNLFVYDAKTGLLLHKGMDALLPGLKAHPGGMVFRTDRQITIVDLIGRRQTRVPWADDAMPDWVAQTRVMHYKDTRRTIPVQFGNLPPFAPPPTIFQTDIAFTEHGNGWVKAKVTTSLGDTFPNAFGTASFGGLWIPPAGLAKLREGQTLDDDPITHVVTMISKVDDTSVTISGSNDNIRSEMTYDKRNGKLLSAHTRGGALGMELSRELVHGNE